MRSAAAPVNAALCARTRGLILICDRITARIPTNSDTMHTDGSSLEKTEAARQRDMLTWFGAIIIPVLFAYGLYDVFSGAQVGIGKVELIIGAVLLLNQLAVFW